MTPDVEQLLATVREAIGNDGLDEFEFKDALAALDSLRDLLRQAQEERDDYRARVEHFSANPLVEALEQAEARVRVLEEALREIEQKASPKEWETPGHPMNGWTRGEPILRAVQAALAADEEGAGASPFPKPKMEELH